MFTPVNGRLLVRPDLVENTTASGIIIASDKIEKPLSGIVVNGTAALPSGDRQISISQGSHILFSALGYDELEADGEKFYAVSESAIIGIF